MNRRKNFIGENFWARGYYVSTAGKDEEVVRRYIQQQETEDRRIDQLNCLKKPPSGGSWFIIRFERFTYFKPPALPEVFDYRLNHITNRGIVSNGPAFLHQYIVVVSY